MGILEFKRREFVSNGVVLFENVIPEKSLKCLKKELEVAISLDAVERPNAFDIGMVHNCMFRGQAMSDLLDCEEMNSFVSDILGHSFILYAYQSSSLQPGIEEGNFGSRVHVDSPRFIENYITNIGVIFPLDDFTEQNGGTYYLPGSQNIAELTKEEEFYSKAKRLVCKKGDMVVFNARVHHAAGVNSTDKVRHALTMNFCRSYMRQRFDFPRMASSHSTLLRSENVKKLLGWNVRMPTALEEFYLPPKERLYKPGQE